MTRLQRLRQLQRDHRREFWINGFHAVALLLNGFVLRGTPWFFWAVLPLTALWVWLVYRWFLQEFDLTVIEQTLDANPAWAGEDEEEV